MSDTTELNVITGQETTRNYTNEEKDALLTLRIDNKDQIDAIVAEEAQKNVLKQEALEALKSLGLSEDQARAVAGL
jgi:hypothetical protein